MEEVLVICLYNIIKVYIARRQSSLMNSGRNLALKYP